MRRAQTALRGGETGLRGRAAIDAVQSGERRRPPPPQQAAVPPVPASPGPDYRVLFRPVDRRDRVHPLRQVAGGGARGTDPGRAAGLLDPEAPPRPRALSRVHLRQLAEDGCQVEGDSASVGQDGEEKPKLCEGLWSDKNAGYEERADFVVIELLGGGESAGGRAQGSRACEDCEGEVREPEILPSIEVVPKAAANRPQRVLGRERKGL
mmetsp:Transcript_4664/g.10975  ORF Transcript_4664/g.10975 Transcript_4664/m.10975 type:complete len:209 (-) Transcript_4664:1422-2048(-)